MQKIILGLVLLLNQLLFSQEQYDVVFKNVTLVSLENNQVVAKQNIAIKDGKIAVIENAKKSKLKGEKEYDLKGQFIMPSLADAHVHLPEKEEELERFFNMNLINGVTKLRSMRGDWKHIEWQKKYNSSDSYFPKLYLSPPPISRSYDLTSEQIEGFVKVSKERGFDFIKILSIKNQSIFSQLDSVCKKYDMALSGHFPRLASGNYLEESVFFNSNYNSIEHLGGLVGEPELFESRLKSIKENQIFICPTLSWYSIGSGQYSFDELEKLPGMEFISAETMKEWIEKTKAYREKIGKQAYEDEVAAELKTLDEKYSVINRLQKEGIKMIVSPDASGKYMITGFNMHTELELLKKAQLTNAEILQMATQNFADLFHENYGSLSVGKDADFIVLENNPLEDLVTLKKVKAVYFNQKYMDTDLLTKMKTDLQKAN